MIPQVELFSFVFWKKKSRHQKDISKLTDLYLNPSLRVSRRLAFELFRSKTLLSLLTYYELTQNGQFFLRSLFPRSLFPRILYTHRSNIQSVLIMYVQKSSVDNPMTLLSTKLPQWILEDVALLVGRGCGGHGGHGGCSGSLPGHGRDDHLCGGGTWQGKNDIVSLKILHVCMKHIWGVISWRSILIFHFHEKLVNTFFQTL